MELQDLRIDTSSVVADDGTEVWELRLYIAGETAKSQAAVQNLRRICDEHLPGRYKVELVDLLKQPQLARGDQIIAIPTLVRKLPNPVRKVIGDLSNTEKTLVGLQLRPVEPGSRSPGGNEMRAPAHG